MMTWQQLGIEWDKFILQLVTYEAYKDVIKGLGTTVLVAVLGMAIGVLVGTILAITKVIPQYSRGARLLNKLSSIYLAIFRGTPILVQLLLGYFVVLPLFGISGNNIVVGIVMFGLNSGAYVCEIMRSGIQSVDIGQMEAGRALGLTYSTSMYKVIIPQAVKNILPTLGNEFVTLIKETSVLGLIAVMDLTKAFESIGNSNYNYIIPYIFLGLIYFVLVMGITALVKALERRLKRSDKSK